MNDELVKTTKSTKNRSFSLLLISGPICSGKSLMANRLAIELGFQILSTRDVILQRYPFLPPDRAAMQAFAKSIEAQSNGAWIADLIKTETAILSENQPVVVDAVRTELQVLRIREAFPLRVYHCHLKCSDKQFLANRFANRKTSSFVEKASYRLSTSDEMERVDVPSLAKIADCVIDSKGPEFDLLVSEIGEHFLS